jgi:hypothetical protein
MPPKSTVLGPGSLTIGEPGSEKEWGAEVTACTLTPSYTTGDAPPTLDGGELAGDDTETWALSGSVFQSYDLDSLHDWCFEHRKEQQPFVFVPNTDHARSYSGVIKIRALSVGGDVKTRNRSDFEFPLIGEPTAGTDGAADPS